MMISDKTARILTLVTLVALVISLVIVGVCGIPNLSRVINPTYEGPKADYIRSGPPNDNTGMPAPTATPWGGVTLPPPTSAPAAGLVVPTPTPAAPIAGMATPTAMTLSPPTFSTLPPGDRALLDNAQDATLNAESAMFDFDVTLNIGADGANNIITMTGAGRFHNSGGLQDIAVHVSGYMTFTTPQQSATGEMEIIWVDNTLYMQGYNSNTDQTTGWIAMPLGDLIDPMAQLELQGPTGTPAPMEMPGMDLCDFSQLDSFSDIMGLLAFEQHILTTRQPGSTGIAQFNT
ncbi:MAG: hypothetical protein K8S97_17140, partial [Anaerolineae bacterium]|nr:hypothetical protein [Anaerolineae bacterium]